MLIFIGCSIGALVNVQLPENCDQVGESCDNFTCDYGYKKNESIDSLNCSASGIWNVDFSTVCIEVICSSDDIQNATLPVNCTGKVGETCDTFSCNYGYSRNPDVIALNCTESGLWNYNLSLICTETFCPRDILNGSIPLECGNKVDDTCGNFTCDYGFRRTELLPEFNCTETGEWTYNASLLCTEVICSSDDIQNATLPANCTGKVGETCDTFTCDYGYSKNPAVIALNCTETGMWSHNLSSICTETLCPREFPIGNISSVCGNNVGDVCGNFTCDYGFRRTELVPEFNCTGTGEWTYNVSLLCTEILCNDNDIANAALPVGCAMRVGETCNTFSCNYGYERNSEIDSLNCTESGLWNYNLSTLCIETVCENIVSNGALAATCLDSKVDESCDNFTCNPGFKKNVNIDQFNCTENGTWGVNLGTLCTEILCNDDDIANAALPVGCTMHVAETCDNFSCNYGYERNPDIDILTCTESGLWNYNLSTLCIETVCQNNVSNGALADNCLDSKVDESCYNFTCNSGFKMNETVSLFNCTENKSWDVSLETLCIEIICPGDVLNGALPGSCQSKAGESCSSYTCNTGFKKNESVTDLSCSESGEWSANLSSLCIEKFCGSTITNGQLSDECSTAINTSCTSIICNEGYTRNEDIISLVCTETGVWAYEISFQCNATMTNAVNCQMTPPASTIMSDWIEELGNSCGYNICSEKFQQWTSNDSVLCMSNDNWAIYPTIRCSASDCSKANTFNQGPAGGFLVAIMLGLIASEITD